MKIKSVIIFCLAIALLPGMFPETAAEKPEKNTDGMLFQEVIITLAGTAATKADYFPGKEGLAVIFAPGAMFAKESWHFLAARFQEMDISGVALNSGSTPDLLNAIAFLKSKGFREIALIGASAGGAGVLSTLSTSTEPLVECVVLLAPAGGPPLQDETIRKLFIVAADDLISSSAEVYKIYINSADPKQYVELKGSEHAQCLFDSKQKEHVIELITRFIKN